MSNLSDKPWLIPGHMYQYDIGWLVDKLLSFETELNTAIDLKTIHYADPIQWDITTQYSPNTVVVDPKTGTAYMSKVPVPSGVLLTNTDYWVVIFNYQRVYDKIMSGVAFNDKDNLNATKDLLVNDLVWYGGDLYRATRTIPQGTTYIPGTNLTPTTIADCLATYYGRDRVAQVLNDTVNVSGDYTLNAGDIAETANNVTIHSTRDMVLDADGNLTEQVTGGKTSEVGGKLTERVTGSREIDVDGDDSVHVDGITSINRGGAVTEVYGSSVDKRVTGAFTESFEDTATSNYNGKRIVKAKDVDVTADSITVASAAKTLPIKFPDKTIDLYNLSDLPDSLIFVNKHGAVGDGITDDTLAFKQILSDITASGKVSTLCLSPDSTYLITDTLDFDIFTTSLIGFGATIKFKDKNSTSSRGVLFNILNSFQLPPDGTFINNYYLGNTAGSFKGFKNVRIINDYNTTIPTSIAFMLEGKPLSTSTPAFQNLAACSMLQFHSVFITGFYIGFQIFSRSYNLYYSGGDMSNYNNIYIPSGGVDYYERLSFVGVAFSGVASTTGSTCFLIQRNQGTITVSDCSIDYCTYISSMNNGSRLVFNNCHFESATDSEYWFQLYGGDPAQTSLCINQCTLSAQSPIKHPIFLVNGDTNFGGLIVHGLDIYCKIDISFYTAYWNSALVNGTGRVLEDGVTFSSYSDICNFAEYKTLLPDWQFENGNAGLTLTNAEYSTEQKHSGNKSLKIATAYGTAKTTVPVINGGTVTGSVWSFSATNTPAYMTVKALNSAGVAISPDYNAVCTGTGTWTQFSIPRNLLPAGTCAVEIQFTASDICYFDDALINII